MGRSLRLMEWVVHASGGGADARVVIAVVAVIIQKYKYKMVPRRLEWQCWGWWMGRSLRLMVDGACDPC